MSCKHQFNKIKEVSRPVKHMDGTTTTTDVIAHRWNDEAGVMVGCALCGEIRITWEDGSIEITKESNEREIKSTDGSTK